MDAEDVPLLPFTGATSHASVTSLRGLQHRGLAFFNRTEIESRGYAFFTPSLKLLKLLHPLYLECRHRGHAHLLKLRVQRTEATPLSLLYWNCRHRSHASITFFTRAPDTPWLHSKELHEQRPRPLHRNYKHREQRPRLLPSVTEKLCVFLSHMVKTNRQAGIWHTHTV